MFIPEKKRLLTQTSSSPEARPWPTAGLPCLHSQKVLTSESEHRPSEACASARNVPRLSLP
jgi:hypothetical protein